MVFNFQHRSAVIHLEGPESLTKQRAKYGAQWTFILFFLLFKESITYRTFIHVLFLYYDHSLLKKCDFYVIKFIYIYSVIFMHTYFSGSYCDSFTKNLSLFILYNPSILCQYHIVNVAETLTFVATTF